MYIHEAVKLAVKFNKFIQRKDSTFFNRVKIKPTSTSDCCIIYHTVGEAEPSPRWCPNADDLSSKKWTLTD